MLRRLALILVAVIGTGLGITIPAALADLVEDDYGGGWEVSYGIEDTTRAGGSAGSVGQAGSQTGSSVPGVPVPDRCLYRKMNPRPGGDDPVWGGHDPAAGDLWTMLCPDSLKVADWDRTGQNTVVEMNESAPYYVSDGVDPGEGAAVIDPSVLIVRARAAVQMPRPEPSFGPSPGELAVKVPVWFSVPVYEPQVRSASAGRFMATVSVELVRTVWLPGEPEDPGFRPERLVPPVVCDGPGTPFEVGMNPGDPPCGYTYIWQSLKDRTDGLGRWVLQVSSDYEVSFEVVNTETGDVVTSGTDTVTTEARVLMPIREWRGMLGDPSMPAPENQQLYPEILPPADDPTD